MTQLRPTCRSAGAAARSRVHAGALAVALVLPTLLTSGCESDGTPSQVAEPGSCPSNSWPPCDGREFSDHGGRFVGDQGWPFQAVDQHGHLTDLRQFAGGMTLVEFGATWCGPCQVDAETAQGFMEDMRENHEFPFWRITVLSDRVVEGRDIAGDWAEAFGLGFPCLAGIGAIHATNIYLVREFPTFLVLDPDLIVRARFVGHSPDHVERLEREVAAGWEAYQAEREPR